MGKKDFKHGQQANSSKDYTLIPKFLKLKLKTAQFQKAEIKKEELKELKQILQEMQINEIIKSFNYIKNRVMLKFKVKFLVILHISAKFLNSENCKKLAEKLEIIKYIKEPDSFENVQVRDYYSFLQAYCEFINMRYSSSEELGLVLKHKINQNLFLKDFGLKEKKFIFFSKINKIFEKISKVFFFV